MNVAASGHASQYLQQLASTGTRQQNAAQASNTQPAQGAEERGESRAAQAAEGETGGRVNTYA